MGRRLRAGEVSIVTSISCDGRERRCPSGETATRRSSSLKGRIRREGSRGHLGSDSLKKSASAMGTMSISPMRGASISAVCPSPRRWTTNF